MATYDYRRDGFTFARRGLDTARVDEINQHLNGLIAALPPGGRSEGLVEPHARAPDWPFWLELCRDPVVLDEVASAMGTSELLLVMSHLIVKPPHDGKEVAWHQDITYWGSVQGEEVCTVWLAIDHVDEGNSCMRVIPRTHQRQHLPKLKTDGTDLLQLRVEVDPEQVAAAVPCVLRPGQFTIHDSFAIHGSPVNSGPRRRAGYTMRYADARNVRIDLAKHWVPVHYVRGDGGNLLPGMVDLRPGRPLQNGPGVLP